MRLLVTASEEPELVEFLGDVDKPYAILSHTWDTEEFTFADLGQPNARQKIGYRKIISALKQAQNDGYSYLWIDTCCIDKSSSAELSEAINSMYYWYQHADICYAYLSDVEIVNDLEQSKWFTRGWTLQELLAPTNVVFFSQAWNKLGDKLSLEKRISAITGIDQDILRGEQTLAETSVARRMSWAANRKNTRIEDTAYCLLGIFSVNMPLFYGEREKAFIRLQEEIIKVTDDQTLFAWRDPSTVHNEHRGLLAHSPLLFAKSADFVSCFDLNSSEPHSILNNRLRIQVRFPNGVPRPRKPAIALLACTDTSYRSGCVGIFLRLWSRGRNEYRRLQCSELVWEFSQVSLVSIQVPQIPSITVRPELVAPRNYTIQLSFSVALKLESIRYITRVEQANGTTLNCWTSVEVLHHLPKSITATALPNSLAFVLQLSVMGKSEPDVVIMVGMNKDFKIGCSVVTGYTTESPEALQSRFRREVRVGASANASVEITATPYNITCFFKQHAPLSFSAEIAIGRND